MTLRRLGCGVAANQSRSGWGCGGSVRPWASRGWRRAAGGGQPLRRSRPAIRPARLSCPRARCCALRARRGDGRVGVHSARVASSAQSARARARGAPGRFAGCGAFGAEEYTGRIEYVVRNPLSSPMALFGVNYPHASFRLVMIDTGALAPTSPRWQHSGHTAVVRCAFVLDWAEVSDAVGLDMLVALLALG